jgi:hypothetical protein
MTHGDQRRVRGILLRLDGVNLMHDETTEVCTCFLFGVSFLRVTSGCALFAHSAFLLTLSPSVESSSPLLFCPPPCARRH